MPILVASTPDLRAMGVDGPILFLVLGLLVLFGLLFAVLGRKRHPKADEPRTAAAEPGAEPGAEGGAGR